MKIKERQMTTQTKKIAKILVKKYWHSARDGFLPSLRAAHDPEMENEVAEE
jgi:hypothetical protein